MGGSIGGGSEGRREAALAGTGVCWVVASRSGSLRQIVYPQSSTTPCALGSGPQDRVKPSSLSRPSREKPHLPTRVDD